MVDRYKKREYRDSNKKDTFELDNSSDNDRKIKIILELEKHDNPISATRLAKMYGVSRQIVVGDIAILRAAGAKIISTNRGYILEKNNNLSITKIFKVKHDFDLMQEELNIFVDSGSRVIDVFVDHEVYGRISANIDVSSRKDVEEFVSKMKSSNTSALSMLTENVHYHTVELKDDESLEYIKRRLEGLNILIEVRDDHDI